MSLSCENCCTSKNGSSFVTLSCQCKVCFACVTKWITLKIAEKQLTIDSKITCLMFDCKKDTDLQTTYQQLPLSLQQKMDEALLQVYFTKQLDIRKCPNSSCGYAGIIDMKQTCSSPFQCDLCGTEWREKEQYTALENLQGWFIQKSQGFSQVFTKPNSKECPSCKTKIEKKGSSDHMTCKQCYYKFCWTCLGEYPVHNQLIHYYQENLIILAIFTAFILVLFPVFGVSTMLGGLSWLIGFILATVAFIFDLIFTVISTLCSAFSNTLAEVSLQSIVKTIIELIGANLSEIMDAILGA